MSTYSAIKSKINPLGGAMGFYDEDDFEKESFLSSVVSVVKETASGVYEATVNVTQEIKGTKSSEKFSMNDSIKFNEKGTQAELEQLQKEKADREKADKKKAFYQTLKEDQQKVQIEKDRIFEEEINDIISNLPTEQKNRLLHYQASYKDKSIYQRAELRKKIIEEQNKAEDQEKAASIPSPAKQPSAMEGAFEGRSGAQGSGSANLSANAVG